jgi:transcriptional regulator NrdR family protein
MKCPICKEAKYLVFDDADGYMQDCRTCMNCGAIWSWSDRLNKIVIVKGSDYEPMS